MAFSWKAAASFKRQAASQGNCAKLAGWMEAAKAGGMAPTGSCLQLAAQNTEA
jgi:hypothetical protein